MIRVLMVCWAKLVEPLTKPVNSMFSEKRSKIYNYFTTFESHDMILAGVMFTPVFFYFQIFIVSSNFFFSELLIFEISAIKALSSAVDV